MTGLPLAAAPSDVQPKVASPKPGGLSEAVECQLVVDLYGQRSTLIVGGLAMPVVALVGYFRTQQLWFVFWALAMVVTLVCRLALDVAFFRRRTDRDRVRLWRNCFIAGAWTLGTLWGLTSLCVVFNVDPRVQMLAISVLAVIVMAAAGRNAGSAAAGKGQIFLGLGPVLIAGLIHGGSFYYTVCVFIMFQFFVALTALRHINRERIRLLCTAEHNLALVNEVRQANADLAAANVALEAAATTDFLTGIANRRRFDAALNEETRRARRDGTELALLMLDIDAFKGFNDRYGHQAGDDCIRRVAGALSGALRRPADLVARYGGEEFAAILPGTDAAAALALAEVIRAAVQELGIETTAGGRTMVTVSLGVAAFVADRHARPEDLIRAADTALYAAKGAGRNRVRAAPDARSADGPPPKPEGALS